MIVTDEKIGGIGRAEQIDETAYNMRKLIINSTTMPAEIRETKWDIRVICETTREARLKVLPDRTVGSIRDFIIRNVRSGTLIKSAGYPSYPEAFR